MVMSKNSLRQSAAMSGCTTPVNIVPQDNACNETVHKQREQTAKSQSENDEGNHGTRRMSLGKLLHPWHTSGSSAARLQEAVSVGDCSVCSKVTAMLQDTILSVHFISV
jgi:hypothetical protein